MEIVEFSIGNKGAKPAERLSKIRRRALLLIATAVLVAFPIVARSAPVSPGPATAPALGAKYAVTFLKRRNDALGAWLPHGEDLFEPWRRHRAANGPLGWDEMFAMRRDATYFWYGNAGPSRVQAVYDPVRRVVLFEQGCCAWQETVLASVSTPPPDRLKTANLGALRSRRGVGLGASPSTVRRAYGPARLFPSTTARGLRILAYYRDQHTKGSACGWFENFVFRSNRLVEIQAGHGC